MNNKGQTIGMGIWFGIIIFIIGMLFINFIMPQVAITRSATDLNCSEPTISDGTKLTCLMVDIVVPYFILLVISLALGLIIDRFVI